MSWVSQDWLESVDDVIREDTLRAMDELRQEQGEGFWEVFGLIARADPEGLLGMGCPPNEYVSEARTIYARLSEAQSIHDVRRIVEEEFQRHFAVGEGAHGERFVDLDYHVKLTDTELNALAAAIWCAWMHQPLADV